MNPAAFKYGTEAGTGCFVPPVSFGVERLPIRSLKTCSRNKKVIKRSKIVRRDVSLRYSIAF